MPVGDIMSRHPVSIRPEDSLAVAAARMRDYDVGCVLVEEDGRLCGILTDRDLACRGVQLGIDVCELAVRDVMTRQVVQCFPEDELEVAMYLLELNGIRRLPVTDRDGHMLGLLSLSDIAAHVPHDRFGSLVARLANRQNTRPTLASLR